MPRLQDTVTKRRLELTGHVIQRPNERIAMEWTPPDGTWPTGRPRNTWRRYIKEDLKIVGTSYHRFRLLTPDWNARHFVDRCYESGVGREQVTLHRPAWRSSCYKGTASFESARITSLKEKCQRRKTKCYSFAPTFTTKVTNGGFHCGRCQQVCGSWIGLSSHLSCHTRQDASGT